MIGLTEGIGSVGSIMVIFVLVLYIFAVAGVILFGDNDPGKRHPPVIVNVLVFTEIK